jgi:hypothetical protein
MPLNPNQFITVTPGQERSGVSTKDWTTHGTISASDALELVTPEMPRIFKTGDYRRTDWSDLDSGKTSIDDFVQYKHSPRLYQIKSERAKWGEPNSVYRHIQRHGLDSSNAIYVMRNPLNTNQVFLTEGHHRVAAAHDIDPDMPIPFIDEGAHLSYDSVLDRALTSKENLTKTEGYLTEYLKDPSRFNIHADNESYEHNRVRRVAFRYSMDAANIRPVSPNSYHWRDYGWHQ